MLLYSLCSRAILFKSMAHLLAAKGLEYANRYCILTREALFGASSFFQFAASAIVGSFKELDPPPWLNRMREIGYPPGYLDVDDEDQPSGITIFTDKDMAETEDGEIMGADSSNPKKKMSVEFPGINAPIPENADERLWAARAARSSSSDHSRNWSQQRSLSYGSNRGYHHEQRAVDLRDDGPPGDHGHSSSIHSFHPRFGGHMSPNLMAELSRGNPLPGEESPKPISFHSLHYSTPERHHSPFQRDSGGSRHGNWTSENQYDRDRNRDLSSRFNDRWQEDRHHRSRR